MVVRGSGGRGRPSSFVAREMQRVSGVIMVLAAVHEADGFYSATGRFGGAARCAASHSRQTSPWAARPGTAMVRSGRGSALSMAATSYTEYMAGRKAQEAASLESPPEEETPSSDGTPVAVVAVPAAAEPEVVDVPVSVPPQEQSSVAEQASSGDGVVGSIEEGMDADASAAGDGDELAVEEAEEVEVEEVVESRTMQLSRRVDEEAQMATSRTRRMADLSSQLKRSFARKEEVEMMITDEIGLLSLKLKQERDIEMVREEELKQLLIEFRETIAEKQELIESEQDLLAQMQALREQVQEPSIRAPVEAAMAKKADVTSIEVMLLEDLVECKEQLEDELQSTSSRADTMSGVVAALPAEDDVGRMRAYNWQDVEELQEVLMSSIESMESSDEQVASLRTKLLDSVQQKKQVLGEESSTELAQAVRVSTGTAFKASSQLSERELLDALADSSKSAAVGVAKSVAAGVSSLGSYAKSPEAQDVAASTVDVIGAISGAAASIGGAFQAAKKEFDDNTMAAEDLTSFDKILTSFKSGINAVKDSTTVKANLDKAGELVGTTLPEAGGRVGKGAANALKGAAASDEIGNPLKETLTSAEKFIVSVAALGTKYFSTSRASRFQLPDKQAGGGGDKKGPAEGGSDPFGQLTSMVTNFLGGGKKQQKPAAAPAEAAPKVVTPAESETPVPAVAVVEEESVSETMASSSSSASSAVEGVEGGVAVGEKTEVVPPSTTATEGQGDAKPSSPTSL